MNRTLYLSTNKVPDQCPLTCGDLLKTIQEFGFHGDGPLAWTRVYSNASRTVRTRVSLYWDILRRRLIVSGSSMDITHPTDPSMKFQWEFDGTDSGMAERVLTRIAGYFEGP